MLSLCLRPLKLCLFINACTNFITAKKLSLSTSKNHFKVLCACGCLSLNDEWSNWMKCYDLYGFAHKGVILRPGPVWMWKKSLFSFCHTSCRGGLKTFNVYVYLTYLEIKWVRGEKVQNPRQFTDMIFPVFVSQGFRMGELKVSADYDWFFLPVVTKVRICPIFHKPHTSQTFWHWNVVFQTDELGHLSLRQQHTLVSSWDLLHCTQHTCELSRSWDM